MSANKLNKNIEKHFQFEKPLNKKTMGIDTEKLIECNTCGLELEYYNFQHIDKGINNYNKTLNSRRCKRCQNARNRVVAKLRKLHPKKPNQVCALKDCNKPAEHLDHDPKSGRFRGWMCPDHNQGYGKIGDNPVAALEFVEYDLQTLEDVDTKKELKRLLKYLIEKIENEHI